MRKEIQQLQDTYNKMKNVELNEEKIKEDKENLMRKIHQANVISPQKTQKNDFG